MPQFRVQMEGLPAESFEAKDREAAFDLYKQKHRDARRFRTVRKDDELVGELNLTPAVIEEVTTKAEAQDVGEEE